MLMIKKFLHAIWNGLNRLRKIVHALLMMVIVIFLVAILTSPSHVSINEKSVLLINPIGRLVDQLQGNAYERAVNEAFGEIAGEVLVDDIIDALDYAKFDDRIKIIFLNKFRVIGMLLPLIKYLILNKPKIIFSAEDHLNVIVVLAKILSFSKAKISTSSRVTPIDTYYDSDKLFSKGWLLKKLYPLVHWKADVMTCVAEDMVKQYKKIFKYTKQVGVYNIVQDKDSMIKMREKLEHSWFQNNKSQLIVASGKLAKWKGFDILINAAKILDEKKINFKIAIIGGGPEKNFLNKLIKFNKLGNKIKIISPVTNTLKYFFNADIFVLSSLQRLFCSH